MLMIVGTSALALNYLSLLLYLAVLFQPVFLHLESKYICTNLSCCKLLTVPFLTDIITAQPRYQVEYAGNIPNASLPEIRGLVCMYLFCVCT